VSGFWVVSARFGDLAAYPSGLVRRLKQLCALWVSPMHTGKSDMGVELAGQFMMGVTGSRGWKTNI